MALEPWLRSPLLSGGVQASEGIMGVSAWQSLGRRSWEEAWGAEEEGRLVRTRSFVAWGWGGDSTAPPGVPRGERAGTAAVEEREDGEGQSGSWSGGDLRLIARIVQAKDVPQGLVLWPDNPCVRLTAAIDGRDVSSQQQALRAAKPTLAAMSGASEDGNEGTGLEASDESGREAMPGQDNSRPGCTEFVLELQMPMMPVALDGEEQSAPPTLSLRVEVLVGRAVTARGEVGLADALKASLSESGSTRTTLSLVGGGEIVLVLDFSRVESLSPSAQGDSRWDQAGMATSPSSPDPGHLCVDGDALEAKVEPERTRFERFLSGIACRGLERGPNSAGGSDSLNILSDAIPAAEAPSVGVNPRDGSGAVSEERLPGSGTGDDLVLLNLVEWLGRSHPDPPFLRKALEKTDNYAFPQVEAPFLAALLKHGGLVGEAFQVAEAMSFRNEGEWTFSEIVS